VQLCGVMGREVQGQNDFLCFLKIELLPFLFIRLILFVYKLLFVTDLYEYDFIPNSLKCNSFYFIIFYIYNVTNKMQFFILF